MVKGELETRCAKCNKLDDQSLIKEKEYKNYRDRKSINEAIKHKYDKMYQGIESLNLKMNVLIAHVEKNEE